MEAKLKRFLGIGLLAALTACAGTVFRQPDVTLRNVQLAGLGLRGGTLLVDVEVANPNRFALNAQSLDYVLSISDIAASGDTAWFEFASGSYQDEFSVGAGDTGSVQIPVEFQYSGLGGAASSLLRAGTFNYRATGTVDVRTPIGSREVPFRRNGRISLLSGSSP